MRNVLRYYALLARRWAWLALLGVGICGGGTYIASRLERPVYAASAYTIINIGTSTSPNIADSLQAVPTFAQLITNPVVLNPVVAQYPGMTAQDLSSMISVKPQSNTQIIEIDVLNSDPQLAADLANQVCQSFARYANTQLSSNIEILPAQKPASPVRPRPLSDAAIGALVGLGLALALVIIFEWIENRITKLEQLQELLGTEVLTTLPSFTRSSRKRQLVESPDLAEKYRALCAHLNTSQALHPFKLILITSAFASEGKSTVAKNVATYLAMTGKKVLLIDANMRRPQLAEQFYLHNHTGLSNLLTEMWAKPRLELYSQASTIPTLRVLTTGAVPMNSTELLQSVSANHFFAQLRSAHFDYVIFDGPPLLVAADTRILASYVEALLLVVDASKTPRKALLRMRQMLKQFNVTLVGVVVNRSPWSDYADRQPYTQTPPLQVEFTPSLATEPDTLVQPAISAPTLDDSRSSPSSSQVIHPWLPMHALPLPTNGLTGRATPTSLPTPRSGLLSQQQNK